MTDTRKIYDFDEIIHREGTDSFKYDARENIFGRADVLPLWVADTDFRVPDFITDAIRKRVDHEIYGYTFRGDKYYEAVIGWFERRQGWSVKKEWITSSPGVVAGLSLCVNAFTEPGDSIIVQVPVYHPFFETVRQNGRTVIENPLTQRDGRYTFDLEDLEAGITDRTKLLFLCSPHNPGGTVWNRDELSALMDICLRHDIIVISDEIHSDLLFPGIRHIPLASLSDEAAANTVVLTAPSKTFNVAGLASSLVIIPDENLRKSYIREIDKGHFGMGNLFGNTALEAAFRHGDDWLDQLMVYLRGNLELLRTFMRDHMPAVKIMVPEATYLVWMDMRAYGLSEEELMKILVEKAGVGLNPGARFGIQGKGWMRLNIGCPRSVLKEALERIASAFAGRHHLRCSKK